MKRGTWAGYHGGVRHLIVSLLVPAGCLPAPTNPRPEPEPEPGGELVTERFTTTTHRTGKFEVEVDVPEGVTHFQVTSVSPDGWFVAVEQVFDPTGARVLWWQDWYYEPYNLTEALYGVGDVNTFDWPIRAEDGELRPGTWRVVGSLVDAYWYYVPDAEVEVATTLKRDEALGAGQVAARVLWAEGVGDDPEVVAAVEAAVERWREVWAAYGVELTVRYEESSLDPRLPWAWRGGDESVVEASAGKEPEELQVVVGEQVRNDPYIYGVAGGIPGTLEITPSTYVVLSWLVHAGIDARFDDDEIRLMGETMAHEVGHYAGLFHPVESSYDLWDALRDTPECARRAACDEELGSNVMFPYAICGAGSCLATDALTDDQVGVLQRYVAVLSGE